MGVIRTSTAHVPPPCPVSIDGRRAVIRPAALTDTVADLAAALGAAHPVLAIDGVTVRGDRRLVDTGLCAGSEIVVGSRRSCGHLAAAGPPAGRHVVEVAVTGGPCCRPWTPLRPGRHVVGRAPRSDVRLDDPTVELHHGFLDVGADGTVTFTQVTGRVPALLDGLPCGSGRVIQPGEALLVGRCRIDVRPHVGRGDATTTPLGARADVDHWRRLVPRGPTPPSGTPPTALTVPASPPEHRAPPLAGLVGAAVAAAGAGLVAAVLGQPMFALFALVGALTSLATWGAGAIAARRRRHRAERQHRRRVDEFVGALGAARAAADTRHRRQHPDVVELLGVGDDRIWTERAGAAVPLRVTLGRGRWRSPAPVAHDDRRLLDADVLVAVERAEQLDDVGVPLDLVASTAVAFRGDPESLRALARSVLVQLAIRHGPADWRLVVVTRASAEWEWVEWLPHRPAVVAPDDGARLAELVPSGSPITVVVTDAADTLALRTGSVRRFLDASGAATVVLATDEVPAVCTRVLELGSAGRADWRHHERVGDGHVHVAGITRATAEAAARRLAPLLDPEVGDADGGRIPTGVSLRRLAPPGAFDPAAIARRWSTSADPAPTATIGLSADGPVEVDLVRDGPHGLIAGTTGAGKSELLRTLVVALAAGSSPDHVSFVLVDFKGGSTFDACTTLPHVVGVVTDLDGGLAERALVSLDAEIRRREQLLRVAGVDDLTAYRRGDGRVLPRLVVVVDEFAGLARELPGFLSALIAVAHRGRSLGVHLLLATQRPAGVVTDDIRANTNLRLALRLPDRSDAIDVVGDPLPSTLSRSTPGRAVLRLGPDELIVFQTASCTSPGHPGSLVVDWCDGGVRATADGSDSQETASGGIDELVTAIAEAALIAGIEPPHRPWLDPLPAVLPPYELADPTDVGIVDDPAAQRRVPLRWAATANLLLVGSLGAGTTTAAIALAVAFLRRGAHDERHLYVVDGNGDARLDAFTGVAHCGGVVRTGESERLDRLLRRLTGEIDRRTLGGGRGARVLVVVDGVAAVRTALGSAEYAEAAARLDRVLREGPAVGIVTCATTDGSSPGALGAVPGERWLFRVDDPSVATALGVVARIDVSGRLVLVEHGLVAQIVHDPDAAARLPRRVHRSGPAPLVVLPAHVDPDLLPRTTGDARSRMLAVGWGAADLSVEHLDVPAGDHVFVGGGSRSGRSTALGRIVDAWREVHPDGDVVIVGRRGLGTDLRPSSVPMLVVVDDADRVADPDGRLAAIAAGRSSEVTMVAAARIETVRAAYGHWLREVTRSQCGLLLTSSGEVDGDLLGATLPRRSPMAARPGLAWLVDRHGPRLAQVAARMPA